MSDETHSQNPEVERPEPAPEGLMAAGLDETTASSPGEVRDDVALNDVHAVDESTGRYSMVSEYAKGGMGRVLLVHDSHLERDIALKELLPGLTDGSTPEMQEHAQELTARFLREAKITGQLEHPSITPVHELGRRDDGTLYYTMKLIRGRTLQEAIQEAGSLEARLKLLPHFVDLCNAIAYAHSRGVIHRDIKPSNVMIGDFGETVVIDWGLAKVKRSKDPGESDPMAKTILSMKTGETEDSAKTRYGQAMGTPAYMPPEQATGDLDAIDERSDVYSLGAVLYEILTGQPPYTGKSAHEIMRKVVLRSPEPPLKINRSIPRVLANLAMRAMAREPEQRVANADALAKQLDGYKPRIYYWNPFRPHLTDLIPELANLSFRERESVGQAAQKKELSRDIKNFEWRRLFLFVVGVFFLIQGVMSPIIASELYQELEDQHERYAQLERAYNIVAATDPVAAAQTSPSGTETSYAPFIWYIRFLAQNGDIVGPMSLAAGLFAYYILFQVLSRVGKEERAPFIREVLAERGYRVR